MEEGNTMSIPRKKRLIHVAKHLKLNNFSSFEALAIKPNKVTDHDRGMIVYYFSEYSGADTLTHWSEWEQRKGIIAKEYPELTAAIHNLNVAERTLKAIVEKIDGDIQNEG